MPGCANNLLRRSVILSFLLANLALSWYAFDFYYVRYVVGKRRHTSSNSKSEHNANNTSIINSTLIVESSISNSDNSSFAGNIGMIGTNHKNSRIGTGILGNTTSDDDNSTMVNETNTTTAKADGSLGTNHSMSTVTKSAYALGMFWWIVTCVLAYLCPLFVVGINSKDPWWWQWLCCSINSRKDCGNGDAIENESIIDAQLYAPDGRIDRTTTTTTTTTTAQSPTVDSSFFEERGYFQRILVTTYSWFEPRRIILWCLVVAPSLVLFVYATLVAFEREKNWALQRIIQEDEPRHGLDWSYVFALAAAMPAGTAGIVSMGIYVFGTVARHSPLWSPYVVLPSDSESDPSSKTNSNNHNAHTNLMRDALRLHQWSGIVAFIWFSLHTILFLYVYGFEGVMKHLHGEPQIPTGTNIAIAVSYKDNNKEMDDETTTKEIILFFLVAAWKAMIPPPECRPILWHRDNDDGDDHSTTRSPCYGYYRNFNGFLAMIAILLLVLTSLAFVRRANYRFFYVSHLILATVFILTMVFHVQRVIVYLLPSVTCYVATTIPTLVQNLVGAIWDDGVRIEDFTVLPSSSSRAGREREGFSDTESVPEDQGVAELTFLVENPSDGIVEGHDAKIMDNRTVSHRPKSIRICVPSISLLWYPFTVIESTMTSSDATFGSFSDTTAPIPTDGEDDADQGTREINNLVECKIIFGTVGYFTKTLYKRLRELQLEQARRDSSQNNTVEDVSDLEEDRFVDENNLRETSGRHRNPPLRTPLLLIDGFYSGASDWIENARNHDYVLIAAGGTGVTPFLTFLPRLLLAVEQKRIRDDKIKRTSTMSSIPSTGLESAEGDSDSNDLSTSKKHSSTAVSFLWCCRDEALIKHVVNNYLLPLFRKHPEELQHQAGDSDCDAVRFRLMIYNTSRDRGDPAPLPLDCSDFDGISYNKCITAPSRGLPMKPFKLQHHPFSSRTRALNRAIAFSATVLVSIQIYFLSIDAVHAKPHSFAIRGYGLYAIFAWSFVMGILTELMWRFGSMSKNFLKGYTIAGQQRNIDEDDVGSSMPSLVSARGLQWANGDDRRRNNSDARFAAEEALSSCSQLGRLESLVPGIIYSDEDEQNSNRQVLELSIFNGRPILAQGENHDSPESNYNIPNRSLSEITLQQVVAAESPGIFYCGPVGLLHTIKTRVTAHRTERYRLAGGCHDNDGDRTIADCTFYEESFEM